MKSSIKRPFQDISDYVKSIVTCMQEDENGEVQYVISIAGKETKYPPFHMAGAYIADRIADIKKDRNSDQCVRGDFCSHSCAFSRRFRATTLRRRSRISKQV